MHFVLLLSICGICVITPLIKKQNNECLKIEAILICIVLFLFSALRSSSVGIDVPGYCRYYDIVAQTSFSNVIHSGFRDIGWSAFVKLLTLVSLNNQLMLVVVGGWFAISISYFAYNMRGNILLTFIFFICLRIFPFTLTGLRQTMAMGFIFFAIVFLQRKKTFSALIFVALACLFHLSAIVFLLAFVLKFIRSDKLLLGVVVCVPIINLMSGNRLIGWVASVTFPSDRFSNYISSAEFQKFSFGYTFLIVVILFVFVSIELKGIIEQDDFDAFLYRLACLGVMFFIIGQSFDNMFRISYYFLGCLFPLFSKAEIVALDRKSIKILNFLIAILLIGQYLIIGPGAGINEYKFFWS